MLKHIDHILYIYGGWVKTDSAGGARHLVSSYSPRSEPSTAPTLDLPVLELIGLIVHQMPGYYANHKTALKYRYQYGWIALDCYRTMHIGREKFKMIINELHAYIDAKLPEEQKKVDEWPAIN